MVDSTRLNATHFSIVKINENHPPGATLMALVVLFGLCGATGIFHFQLAGGVGFWSESSSRWYQKMIFVYQLSLFFQPIYCNTMQHLRNSLGTSEWKWWYVKVIPYGDRWSPLKDNLQTPPWWSGKPWYRRRKVWTGNWSSSILEYSNLYLSKLFRYLTWRGGVCFAAWLQPKRFFSPQYPCIFSGYFLGPPILNSCHTFGEVINGRDNFHPRWILRNTPIGYTPEV